MSDIKIFDYDLAVVGGGPAGMAAAIAAYDRGVKKVVILERDDELGGILRQCIHTGFGLHTFGEELSGPEYAYRYLEQVRERGIYRLTDTMVTNIEGGDKKLVTAQNAKNGIFKIRASAVVLAMGCRERPKGALGIAGSRPAGIYTAGTAQKYVNMKGYMPGKRVVILGSGDIGLIMARRMTLEGAEVLAVLELMPYSGGLARNIEQCLNDFNIPLMLSHTVVAVHGKDRVTGVTIAEVDENRRPIEETKQYIECDTLLLSCGLIPENELTQASGISLDRVTSGAKVDERRQTELEGIFACGNVLHVHDLVDFVSEEGALAGNAAADYISGKLGAPERVINIRGEGAVRYTVPQKIVGYEAVKLYFRVGAVMENKTVKAYSGDKLLAKKKRLKLAPGEMETIEISTKALAEAKDEIVLRIED